jgi:hypothetical protein
MICSYIFVYLNFIFNNSFLNIDRIPMTDVMTVSDRLSMQDDPDNNSPYPHQARNKIAP